MNATAKAAVMSACLSPEQFRVQLAEAPAPAESATGAVDQISTRAVVIETFTAPRLAARADGQKAGVVGLSAATRDLGITKDAVVTPPEAKEATREAAFQMSEAEKFEAGAAAARALRSPVLGDTPEILKHQEGAAAMRALFGKALVPPAEMQKFAAGAEAARAMLGRVVGSDAEKLKFQQGREAALAVLGRSPPTVAASVGAVGSGGTDAEKFEAGRAAALKLLGRTERPSAT
jgi:hypothetical protein